MRKRNHRPVSSREVYVPISLRARLQLARSFTAVYGLHSSDYVAFEANAVSVILPRLRAVVTAKIDQLSLTIEGADITVTVNSGSHILSLPITYKVCSARETARRWYLCRCSRNAFGDTIACELNISDRQVHFCDLYVCRVPLMFVVRQALQWWTAAESRNRGLDSLRSGSLSKYSLSSSIRPYASPSSATSQCSVSSLSSPVSSWYLSRSRSLARGRRLVQLRPNGRTRIRLVFFNFAHADRFSVSLHRLRSVHEAWISEHRP